LFSYLNTILLQYTLAVHTEECYNIGLVRVACLSASSIWMLLGPEWSTLQSEDDNSDGKTKEVVFWKTGVYSSYCDKPHRHKGTFMVHCFHITA